MNVSTLVSLLLEDVDPDLLNAASWSLLGGSRRTVYFDSEAAKWAMDNGANPNVLYGPDSNVKYAPLHAASKIGDTEHVHLLINYGADVNIKDTLNCTPLHWACYWMRPEIVKILLDSDADPNIKNVDGKTPYDVIAATEKSGLRSYDSKNTELMKNLLIKASASSPYKPPKV